MDAVTCLQAVVVVNAILSLKGKRDRPGTLLMKVTFSKDWFQKL